MKYLSRAGLGLVILMLSQALFAFGPKTIKKLTESSLILAPPALRSTLMAYPKQLDRGIDSVLLEFEGAPKGAIESAVVSEMEVITRLPSSQAPFESIVFHFGRVAGLAWLANDPLRFGEDQRIKDIRLDYYSYIERKLSKLVVAFDGYDSPPLESSVREYLDWRIANGARYRKALIFCYYKNGRRVSSTNFDDLSNAFGVAQNILTHGVSDAVKLWFAMWSSIDGDVAGTPYYRPEKGPDEKEKPKNRKTAELANG